MALAVSCQILDDSFFLGPQRGTRYGPYGRDSTGSGIPAPPAPDTVLLFTALEFPPGYDWRQDSAYYSQEGQVVLYRDFEPVAHADIGPSHKVSAEADMHHIVDGHLFTEYSGQGQTVIKMDGAEILRYEGREMLQGLLIRNGSIVTLGRDRNGGGFRCRVDGKVVFGRDSASVKGGMRDPSCGEGGALYMERGILCFAYSDRRGCHIVEDWKDSLLAAGAGPFPDARRRGGKYYFISCAGGRTSLYADDRVSDISEGGRIVWTDARIRFLDGKCAVTGQAADHITGKSGAAVCREGLRTEWLASGGGRQFIYDNGRGLYVVGAGTDGRIGIRPASGSARAPDGSYYFLDAACGFLSGSTQYLALTPTGREGYPFIWEGGEVHELGINGLLTCVRTALVFPGDGS